MILNCTMCVKIKDIYHLNTLYCEWPWGRFLSVVKALKLVKIQKSEIYVFIHIFQSHLMDWIGIFGRPVLVPEPYV